MTNHHPARKAVPFLGCNLLALALACWPAGLRAESASAGNPGGTAPVASVETEGDGAPVRPDYYDVESAPRFERRALMHASMYTKSGDFVNAARILEEHLRDHPDQDHPLVRLHLAQNQADAGNAAAARDNYRRAVEMQPALERAWFGLADAAYDLAEYAVAADAFERGYAVDPARPVDVLYYAAASWLMAERPEEAVRVLERLTTDPAQPPQLRWVQAYLAAASRLEKPELAAHALQHLLDANPEDADAWYLRYQYDAARRDFQAAAVALRVVGLLPLSRRRGEADGRPAAPPPAWPSSRASTTGAACRPGDAGRVERLASALVAAHETEQAVEVLKGGAGARADDPPGRWPATCTTCARVCRSSRRLRARGGRRRRVWPRLADAGLLRAGAGPPRPGARTAGARGGVPGTTGHGAAVDPEGAEATGGMNPAPALRPSATCAPTAPPHRR
ncbi:MAG: tetratricopeptide repeat protein [bacterium]|nr:tetratricopeptide repeat protein [bacterium]